jgi:hypothetical protein
MIQADGVCPLCESSGEVGQACSEKVCTREGTHFIPQDYFRKFQENKSLLDDLPTEFLIKT